MKKRISFIVVLIYLALSMTSCANTKSIDNPQPSLSQSAEAPITVASDISQLRAQIAEKKEENPDTVGWLIVPGTDIDSAIVQNPPDDNSYYLTHDFYRNTSKTATYSADRRCNFTSGLRQDIPQNIALFGHSFDENPDGELFSQLKKYKNPEFARNHPYIFFSTAEEDMTWEVFAVFDVSVDVPYIYPDLEWETLSSVLDVIYDASIYDYEVKITEDDRLLTITCCTYSIPGNEKLSPDIPNNYRFAVMARLVSSDEPIKEIATFSINENPFPPEDMPKIYHKGVDILMYDGTVCMKATNLNSYAQLDLSDATPIGKIKRSGITVNLQDWDAIQLETGTQILQHNNENEILVAVKNGELIPYLKLNY